MHPYEKHFESGVRENENQEHDILENDLNFQMIALLRMIGLNKGNNSRGRIRHSGLYIRFVDR